VTRATVAPQRVARALEAERLAATKAEAARADLARELAAAQSDGYSVRELAALFGLHPTQVQRLIAQAKGGQS
jgi:Helix-turn-helix domain